MQNFDYHFAETNDNVMGFFKFLFQNADTVLEYDAKKKSPVNGNARAKTVMSLHAFMN